MAKRKSKPKNARRRNVNSVSAKNKRSNSSFIKMTILAVIVAAVIYFGFFYGNQNGMPVNIQPTASPIIPSQILQRGGSCQLDNQCFITHCKGQGSSCVNVTDLTYYGKNCGTLSDWIVDKQDPSICGCVGNSCMLR